LVKSESFDTTVNHS